MQAGIKYKPKDNNYVPQALPFDSTGLANLGGLHTVEFGPAACLATAACNQSKGRYPYSLTMSLTFDWVASCSSQTSRSRVGWARHCS